MSGIFNLTLNEVHALSESTQSFPTDTNFNAAGYDDGSGATTVESNSVTLSKADSWWNLSYLYNKQLTIKNLSGDDLAANATMQYKVNTKELYDAGQLQADCDDLRIVYYTGSGSHTEVTRSTHVPGGFTNCSDSTNTTVAFPLQAGLTNGSSTTHYYLYYGNADATNPGYGDNGYSIGDAEATLVCPFDGTTTCVDGETPSTATGAIRYSTKGALSFDGSGDTANFGNNVSLSDLPNNDMTIEGWMKRNGQQNQNYAYFIQKSWYLRMASGGGLLDFIVPLSGGQARTYSSTVPDGGWFHWAVVWDSSTKSSDIYINGTLSNSSKGSGSGSYSSDTATSLVMNGVASEYYRGMLDEVRISNTKRYTENFTPQTTPFEPDANTKLLLHFDENGDDPRNTGKAIDSSGNGNHGTITGAKYFGGLVGVDSSSSDSGNVGPSSYGSHNGIFIEEGTTNKITNPSFENATAYNTNWGSNYFNYDSSADTFTASMAKRNSAGPFAAGVLMQGKLDSTGNTDTLTYSQGTGIGGSAISGNSFTSNFDVDQGSIVFWITPEWSGNDGLGHTIYSSQGSGINTLYKNSSGYLRWDFGWNNYAQADVSSWVAGNTYAVVVRWDKNNKLDGTNHISISVNDSHTFGLTSSSTSDYNNTTHYIGSATDGTSPANALIEGFTIYRRPLFDGTYGIDVGNGDEINQIYNSGTGKDPTLVTGSWDVAFALPTNASTGALTTGTGNAWSHPHASNLLYTSTTNTGGFMMNGTASSDGWSGAAGDIQTLTLQPDATAGIDTRIYEAAATSNYGTSDFLQVNGGGTGYGYKSLLKFDLSSLAGATIASATLDLYQHSTNYGLDNATNTLNRVLSGNSGWTEAGANWNTTNGSASWAGSAGASTSDTDYSSTSMGSFVWDREGAVGTEYSISLSTSELASMVSSNNGMILRSNTGADTARIASSDHATAGYRPKLVVNYTLPAPSASSLSTDEKIFSGGYKFTSTGPNQGIYRTFTATSGGDYVIRAIGHSDGTCDPQVKITRADGTTEISHLDGTTTSTRTDPDVYIFTWEAPAAEANQIQLLNTASSGTCYWHQVEVLSNSMNNPSLETGSGDPWLPSWISTNSGLDSGDTEQSTTDVYSGSSAWKINSGANYESAFYAGVSGLSTDTFISMGMAVKGLGTNTLVGYHECPSPYRNMGIYSKGSASWTHSFGVIKNYSFCHGLNAFYGNSGFIDDVYSFKLTDVSLTVTPASEANSTESTGLRVDGADTLTQTISGLSTDRGVIKFKFTPRHSAANAIKFWEGSGASPRVFYASDGTSNNYIDLRWDGADTLSMYYAMNGTTGNASYNATTAGEFAAGTTYNLEIRYLGGGSMVLSVNGTDRITASSIPAAFGTIPTTVYWGSHSNGLRQVDGTISNFTALTPTENTTSPYYKFGAKSAKLVNAGSYADEYTTAIDPDSTATHTLSAYVYDGTSGNIGGTVSSSIAKLVFGGVVVTPSSYTDMGGGWWRLSYSSSTSDASRLYGVQALAGKTIYVDGLQLEAKSYATTFADGSLGTGYSWSGTANDSTSSRVGGLNNYTSGLGTSASSGAISFWTKLNWSGSDGPGGQYDRISYVKVGSGGWGWGNGFTINTYRNSVGETLSNFQVHHYGSGSTTPTVTKTLTKNNWYHVVYSWGSGSSILYVNGTASSPATFNTNTDNGLISLGAPSYASLPNSTISDLRGYNSSLSSDEVADLYYTGLQTHQSGSEVDDRYGTGTYTSPVVDLSANGAWGSTPFTATETLNSGTISYSTRTSSDNATWSDWEAISGSTIASDARRYLQWKADLAPADSPTSGAPILTAVDVAYVEDSTAPDNPTNTALGFSTSAVGTADLTSATWYNYATPKFTWDAGTDPAASGQSASGVASYHALLTTNNSAVPADNTGDDCYALISAGAESYTVGTSNANCSLSNGVYYLRLQTKDNSGNVADPVTLFTYQFDSSIPNAPSNVATGNVGYQSTNSYTFFWPTATDNGPAGVVGYEYKTGASSGDYSDWQFTANTEVTGVPAYQEGQNFFYVRTKDNAGNYSGSTSNDIQIASFYYNETAPNAPTNLSISPSTSSSSPSDSNVFTVTWDKPSSYSGDISKYYYCVNCTPSRENMTETTPTQTVNETITSAALATQQGKNTLYIVAEDNNVNSTTGRGNANFEAYASVDFYATTTAPGKPTNLTVSDVSDRAEEKWRLSLAWDAPTTGGTPAHYKVYRSTDNKDFTLIGQTTSPAYTDSGLTQSKTYYYKAYAIDNAGSSSLATSTVSLAPEGKYDDPPSNGGTPTVTEGSTTATITWTSNRISYGTVEYGKTSSLGSSANESTPTVDHSIKLTGLTPGVVYYYRVQALDEGNLVGYERTDAYSSVYSFTTLSQSNISDVTVTDLGLDTAVVSWKTSSLSTSQVDYGTSTEYGESLSVSTTASESLHSARLTGLKHSTKYHFRIKGTTVDDTDISSEDYTFETITLPKVTAVVFKTNQEEGGTAAVLGFSTNVPTTAQVEYQAVDLDTNELDLNMLNKIASYMPEDEADNLKPDNINLAKAKGMDQTVLASLPVIPKGDTQTIYDGQIQDRHLLKAKGLQDGAIYIFTIKGFDKYGNETSSDPIRYITGADTVPPTIRNLKIETPIVGSGNSSAGQIIVSFETDEASRGKVLWGYGTGTEYSSEIASNSGYIDKHVVIIRDLDLTSTYHIKVVAEDMANNVSESGDNVVVTPTPAQAAFDVVLENLEDIFGFLNL